MMLRQFWHQTAAQLACLARFEYQTTEIFLDHKGINYLPEDLLHLQMKLDILEGKQENQEIQATGG